MNYDTTATTVLLTVAVVAGAVVGSFAVAGQPTAGEIRIGSDTSETEIEQGETKTLQVNYEAPDGQTPDTVGFELNYDSDVLSITEADVSPGGYLNNAIDDKNVSNGVIEFTDFSLNPENPTVNPGEPIATIDVELADGVAEGDQTTLEFTGTTVFPESLGTPQSVDETITVVSAPETGSAFTINDLSPTADVQPGQQVTLQPTITNEGQQSATETVTFELGSERRTSELTLTGGESTQLSETLPAPTEPGNVTYNVSTDGDFVTGEITVRETTSDDIVEIQDSPTISPTPIDSTPSEHTLNFDVANVSADNKTDEFTVTLPEEVTVEDITETTVTDANDNPINVPDDPAEEDNRKIKFTVNPDSEETEVKTLTVKVTMELSATP